MSSLLRLSNDDTRLQTAIFQNISPGYGVPALAGRTSDEACTASGVPHHDAPTCRAEALAKAEAMRRWFMRHCNPQPRRGDMFIVCAAANTKAPEERHIYAFQPSTAHWTHEVASDSYGVPALAGRTSDEACTASEFRITTRRSYAKVVSYGIAIPQPTLSNLKFPIRDPASSLVLHGNSKPCTPTLHSPEPRRGDILVVSRAPRPPKLHCIACPLRISYRKSRSLFTTPNPSAAREAISFAKRHMWMRHRAV